MKRRTSPGHGSSMIVSVSSTCRQQKWKIIVRQLFGRTKVDHVKETSSTSKSALMEKWGPFVIRRWTGPLNPTSFETLIVDAGECRG